MTCWAETTGSGKVQSLGTYFREDVVLYIAFHFKVSQINEQYFELRGVFMFAVMSQRDDGSQDVL